MGGGGQMGVGGGYSNFKTVRCKFFDQGKFWFRILHSDYKSF